VRDAAGSLGAVTGRFLAVDVGGSRIKSAVVVDGIAQEHRPQPVARDLSGLLDQIVRVYERAAAGKELSWGLCMPGLIDVPRGTVRYSAGLGLRKVPVLDLLERDLPRPRVFVNDLVAAAVGEAAGGTIALIQIGTGIAGRWVVDGAALPGTNGYPGEIGHLRFRVDGRQCDCGNRGCAEAYGGWGAIRHRYEEAGRPVSSPAAVLRDARTDPWAGAVLEDALEAIGFAASALVAVCDPGTLRVGGGLAAAWGDALLASIRRTLTVGVLAELAAATRVEGTKFGERSSLIGLATLASQDVA
jgi:glucokinase